MPNPASDTQLPDVQLRFLLPHAGVRGIHVRLEGAWREILSHAHYPPAAQQLLGEASVAAALFTGHVKVGGRLSLQLRAAGPLRTLFAECTAAHTLRGIVRWDDGTALTRDLTRLGDDAVLAITIENPGLDPREPQRYQSLVALRAPTLAEAFEDYFRQSEQLPTRLLLVADGEAAAGLMLQKLPGDAGDDDGWNRIGALFDTLGEAELLATPAATLLQRLFHEEGFEVLAGQPLRFACSCSRERVAGMLRSLGRAEAEAAAIDGTAEVRCEFCGRRYLFSETEIVELFAPAPVQAQAPAHLQ
ncbi:Hsp33 family molecular chaperone HslO [Pseudoxanthomonas sangjuensis]|uniref:Hsp33 family molecular chaperone HslO n=1 Tax=Pseudoxanthomonas sangjuensis TaxID=1503750 RepID=UPI00139196FC|nr:Hsp33 family molecular chaperone HslO [Pseudoxanthomonas sangjuensis]KAF1713117.1 heat-shock protein Hsp33 [Pseudoxanthomonas sangjuensis]